MPAVTLLTKVNLQIGLSRWRGHAGDVIEVSEDAAGIITGKGWGVLVASRPEPAEPRPARTRRKRV